MYIVGQKFVWGKNEAPSPSVHYDLPGFIHAAFIGRVESSVCVQLVTVVFYKYVFSVFSQEYLNRINSLNINKIAASFIFLWRTFF